MRLSDGPSIQRTTWITFVLLVATCSTWFLSHIPSTLSVCSPMQHSTTATDFIRHVNPTPATFEAPRVTDTLGRETAPRGQRFVPPPTLHVDPPSPGLCAGHRVQEPQYKPERWHIMVQCSAQLELGSHLLVLPPTLIPWGTLGLRSTRDPNCKSY